MPTRCPAATTATSTRATRQEGWQRFLGKVGCTSCHAPPFYGSSLLFNIGLEHSKHKPEPGRFNVTKNEVDRGAPKTPSRHSVALGAPYFHNGQTATLKEPVRYMASGGKPDPNRTLLLQPRNLSEAG